MEPKSRNAKNSKEPQKEGISAITVKCFKSIHDEQRIEIAPLTLLAGANSSGKSSTMQPLLLLKQTLEAGYDPGALLLNGPNVKFTSAEQFFCGTGAKRIDHFSAGIETTSEQKIQFLFKKPKKETIFVENVEWSKNNLSYSLSHNMSFENIKKMLESTPEIDPIFNEFRGDMKNELKKLSKEYELGITRDRCFLKIASNTHSHRNFLMGYLINLINQKFITISDTITNIIHLPGLRGNPQRDYQKTAAGPTFPGAFQDYVAGIILDWKEKQDPRLGELGTLLQNLGLTWKIDAKPIKDTSVEVRVGRMPSAAQGGARDLVSIADVGFGVSQSLPVLVALLVAEPGHTVYLEQPEIHLHPRAQVAMADIIADASKRGVRVIAETHSALLLLRIQTLVAKNYISPEVVKLHWFSRNDHDGYTKIESANLDSKGAYGRDWPEDFGKVIMAAEKDYLDAADEWDFDDNDR